MVEIYECTLTPHDFFFFTTKGFQDTLMTDYIGNYALMYAINRHLQETQRNASGVVPLYEEDLRRFTIYTTPAKAVGAPTITLTIGSNPAISWPMQDMVYHTYNAINTISQTTEVPRLNFPLVGRKLKQPPLTAFEFYAIGGEPRGLVRIGKKQIPARIQASRLEVENIVDGEFEPDHPLNPSDYDLLDLKRGNLIRQFPPLVAEARISTLHYVCKSRFGKKLIAKPSLHRFKSVILE